MMAPQKQTTAKKIEAGKTQNPTENQTVRKSKRKITPQGLGPGTDTPVVATCLLHVGQKYEPTVTM